MLKWHFHRSSFKPFHDIYITWPFNQSREVSIEHLRQIWHTNRGRLLLMTAGLIIFGNCICYTCLDLSFLPNLSLFSRLCISNIRRYFLDFTCKVNNSILCSVIQLLLFWTVSPSQVYCCIARFYILPCKTSMWIKGKDLVTEHLLDPDKGIANI